MRDVGYDVKISSKAINFLCEKGFDQKYGARPLKRAIQQYIENPLATYLLEGRYVAGDVIQVTSENDSFVFSKKDETVTMGSDK